MVLLNVVDDDCAKVRARHVPVEVHLGEGGTRVVVLAGVVVERATKLTGLQEHLTLEMFPSLAIRWALDFMIPK